RNHHTRDILETMAGLSPATGGVTNAVPRFLWLHRLNPVTEKEPPSLSSNALLRTNKLLPKKLKAPTGYLFGYRSGLFSTRLWKSLANPSSILSGIRRSRSLQPECQNVDRARIAAH